MTAKQMFESLGWEQTSDHEAWVAYKNKYMSICFVKPTKAISIMRGDIDTNVFLACYEQMRELGWFDERDDHEHRPEGTI